jgi:hypothetical protein
MKENIILPIIMTKENVTIGIGENSESTPKKLVF